MFSRLSSICIILLTILLTSGIITFAADTAEEKPQAKTIIDPDIPVDELQLILKPFTKDELLIEAEGWQALVRKKAVDIALEEIAAKRQTQEIKKAEKIQEQTEEAQKELKHIKEQTKKAELSGDTALMKEAEKSAEKTQKKIEAVQETITEAEDAADKTADVYQHVSKKSKQGLKETSVAVDSAKVAVDKVQDLVGDAEEQKTSEVKISAQEATQATTAAQEAIKTVSEKVTGATSSQEEDRSKTLLEDTAHLMEETQEAKEEEKIDLLQHVNRLREERVKLVDNFRAVVEELKHKTDVDDSKTQAIIKDYLLYIQGVSGLNIDISDTTSAKIAVMGWLKSEEGGIRWAKNFFFFFGLLIGSWFLSIFLSHIAKKATEKLETPQLLAQFLIGAVRWVVMIGGIIIALTALEVSITPLLALVGAAGFIVAFALQDSLSNFASGIMILFFRPFDVNDTVEAGGVSGKVTSMNLISTTIRTFDNKVMIVPNNSIFRNVITNSTSVNMRRVDLEFGIGYGDDIDQTIAILEDIVTSHPKVLKKPEPTIRVTNLADSSVTFICRPWTRSDDYWDVYWDVIEMVKKRFDAEGISIPYPQQDIHLHIQDSSQLSAVTESAA
ncbi:MAG: mechanosensitive ion channel domain-containing protein [Thermodesulfobacteriota bacterium]